MTALTANLKAAVSSPGNPADKTWLQQERQRLNITACSEASREARWLRQSQGDAEGFRTFTDSQGALSQPPEPRTKHIDVCYYNSQDLHAKVLANTITQARMIAPPTFSKKPFQGIEVDTLAKLWGYGERNEKGGRVKVDLRLRPALRPKGSKATKKKK